MMARRDGRWLAVGLVGGLGAGVALGLFGMGLFGTTALRSGALERLPGLASHAGTVRRVVTGHDAAGHSVVLSDTAAPRSQQFGDVAFIELWRTLSAPAPIEPEPDGEPTDGVLALGQRGGSVLRLVDYQPAAHGGRQTPMHRTETVDYAIVLQGEIVLILDHSQVLLKPGDVVVQRGTAHAWENRSDQVARVAFVLLDGVFGRGLATQLAGATLTP